jgi:hypothetical protein
MNFLNLFDGWKTILAGSSMIVLGLYCITEGNNEQGLQMILTGMAALGLRHAISKSAK